MDECHLTRSPSVSSFDTNHSSWSFVGEDDFDLLDEGDDSSSENIINEIEEDGKKVEDDDDDDDNGNDNDNDNDDDDDECEDSTNDDDDISVVPEEDILNDPSVLTYTDVVKVSEQLDELSRRFDSPFKHMLEDFALERNIRLIAIISAAAIAIVTFYYAVGVGKPESLSFTSTENVCFVNEDRFLGLQYRDVPPSFLRPFFETLLKPSIPVWSALPSSIPKPHAFKPFSWIFNAESISASQDKPRYFTTNQCERVSIEHQFSSGSETVRRYLRHTKKLKKPCKYESPILPNVSETLIDGKSTETTHDRKFQMEVEVINSSGNWNSRETESSNSEPIKTEISKFYKPSSFSKLILPIPHKDCLVNPEANSTVSSQELQREIISVPESITDLERVEKKCFKAVTDAKNIKSLVKKGTKLRDNIDLRFKLDSVRYKFDSRLRELEKRLESIFSANHLLIEPKIELITAVPSRELPVQREITSVPESIADLKRVEKKCFKAATDTKTTKSLVKKRTKPRDNIDLRFKLDSRLRRLEKRLESKSKKETVQSKEGKSDVLVISSMKKVSRTFKQARAHRDKILEKLDRAVDNVVQKNRPKTFRMGKKTNVGKKRCVLNSTCNVLANLARTLASITLFPAIVGQTNAAKYINSLLDLSTCTGLRLVCEKCWWTRESCPKERCTFFPWQRHFNTKRFLTSQGHKMFDTFRELGWSMPGKKRKGSDGKLKFKFDYPSRLACSEKEMRSRQSKKKSIERYPRKSCIQGRIH
uniref:Ribosome biogenesis protein NOP53 n=1 Tax=Elaeophora elaphi TaxID=1147741 RepID=A0A0R3RFY2_9BILA